MRRILFVLLFTLAVPVGVHAAPFAVADSYTTGVIPDTFKVSLDGAAEIASPAFSGTMSDGTVLTNTLHFDVGAVTVGAHSLTVKACKDNGVWGEACSAASPFSFTRPALAAPAIPTGTSLKR